jgi:hypothetical protein
MSGLAELDLYGIAYLAGGAAQLGGGSVLGMGGDAGTGL